MTDSTSEAQRARIAALKARRESAAETAVPPAPAITPKGPETSTDATPRRSKKGHVAIGGRIAAAGIGASGFLGIVTIIGVVSADDQVDSEPSDAEVGQPQTPGTATDSQLVQGDSFEPGAAPNRASPGTAVTAGSAVAEPAPTPIYLTANPVVRTITVQPPPVIVTIVDPAPASPIVGGPRAQTTAPLPTTAAPVPAPDADPQPAPPAVVVAPAPATAPEPAAPAAEPAPPAAEPAPEPARSKGSG